MVCPDGSIQLTIAEWDALRAERDKLAGLVDSWRHLLDACAPYLKDGETPAERIERERKDLTATVGMLANERRRAEDLFQQCRLGFEYREELRARVAEEERAHSVTIDERDQYHEMADKLADAIAAHFGEGIGEHSNLNCPWTQALELIESRASASAEGG